MAVWKCLTVIVMLPSMLGNAVMTIFVRLTVFLPIVSRMLLLEPRILVAKPAPRGGWPTLILKQSNLKQTELVFRLCGLLTTRIPSNRRSPMTAAATCIAIPQDPRKLMKQIECVARVRMLTTMIIERCGASIGTTPTRPLPCRTCNRQPLMIWCVVILKKLSYLKVQPVGSEPSNLGTSSFRRCVEPVTVGVCPAEEDDGVYGGCWFALSCVILCRRSSIFVFIASWDADNFAMSQELPRLTPWTICSVREKQCLRCFVGS